MPRWTLRAFAAPLALVPASTSALSTTAVWSWTSLSGGSGLMNSSGWFPIPWVIVFDFPVTLAVFDLLIFITARARSMVPLVASPSVGAVGRGPFAAFAPPHRNRRATAQPQVGAAHIVLYFRVVAATIAPQRARIGT